MQLPKDKTMPYNYWMRAHLADYMNKDVRSGKIKTDDNGNLINTRGWDLDFVIYINEGEELDFNDPGVRFVFTLDISKKIKSDWVLVSSEESNELFKAEFDNSFELYNRNYNDFYIHHLYKLNDNIEYESDYELKNMIRYLLKVNLKDKNFIRDEDGRIRYIDFTLDYCQLTEMSIPLSAIKSIASEVPKEEAKEIYKNELERWASGDFGYEEDENYDEETKRLEELNSGNTLLLPGSNGDFTHNDSLPTGRSVIEMYSIDDIKRFYENVGKQLSGEISQNLCFYGGTIPYILNNEKNCRSFGDVDIIAPIEWMAPLRKELEKLQSFHMITDSMNKTRAAHLTTYTYDGWHVYQDYGFKARLFGINISVFPMYQYGNNIFTKSFNINEIYNFLLNIRFMNDMKIGELFKTAELCGTRTKILPLEFTIVSKENRVGDPRYERRHAKDMEDLRYIVAHAKELNISQDKVEFLRDHYPDYSVDVAYDVSNPRSVETIRGDKYKELILRYYHSNMS